MTHPVEIDALLERFECVPHDESPLFVCEAKEIASDGCICGLLERLRLSGAIGRCEHIGNAFGGWLSVGIEGRIERWASDESPPLMAYAQKQTEGGKP